MKTGCVSTDSRIVSVTDTHVSFHWKDRANGDLRKTETITGPEFVKRYLRHVLPRGLRAVRYHGFCHPAAKVKRERIAFHTGRPLLVGAAGRDCGADTAVVVKLEEKKLRKGREKT